MHWANTVGMLSNLTPTSLGFFNDSMRLLRRFVQEEDDGFETFRKLYIDMCFPSIDIATKSCPSQLKQLYFEMFSVVVIYCFPPAILKRRIGAVYLLYSLYFQQPRDERVYIRLIVDQFVEFSKFRVSLVKDGYREAAYCLYQLFRKQAFYITAYSNECNPYLTLCELYRNEMRKISDLYAKEVIHEELAHSTEAKTLDVIHKYYVDVRNRLLESLPKNDRLKFTPKINAGTEDILGIAPLPSIKDAKLKALKRTHKVVEDYVVDDEIGEQDNEGDEYDYDLPSTSTSCTKYQKKSEARKNVKASSQNRRNKANYTSSSTSADDSAFEGVNWELVKYLDVRRFVFFSKDAGGGWFFSFFFPFPMLNHCNLPSSSSIQGPRKIGLAAGCSHMSHVAQGQGFGSGVEFTGSAALQSSLIWRLRPVVRLGQWNRRRHPELVVQVDNGRRVERITESVLQPAGVSELASSLPVEQVALADDLPAEQIRKHHTQADWQDRRADHRTEHQSVTFEQLLQRLQTSLAVYTAQQVGDRLFLGSETADDARQRRRTVGVGCRPPTARMGHCAAFRRRVVVGAVEQRIETPLPVAVGTDATALELTLQIVDHVLDVVVDVVAFQGAGQQCTQAQTDRRVRIEQYERQEAAQHQQHVGDEQHQREALQHADVFPQRTGAAKQRNHAHGRAEHDQHYARVEEKVHRFDHRSKIFGVQVEAKQRGAVDTSLAVDSSENQVDEEDVLLGSALEKTLLQLNSANTGPADDGHSSLTVDQSMDEQSDSEIRNRLRPRPRANVNSLGKLSKAMLFEKATNAWHRYLEILTRHPLKTQMLITGFLMGAGDVSSQIFIETKKKPKRFDFVRTARFICIGSFFFAPLLKSWFAFLQNRIHCKAFPRLSPVKRLFADQIICSPVVLASFLVLLRTLEMKPIKTAFHQCRTQFWDIYLTGLKVWPLMQLVNFYLVPLEHHPSCHCFAKTVIRL
ncbi:Protein SYM1 [Trichinella sp. T9]|nr:Protein SYM1 [Trichinella sp. T9]